MSRADRSGRPRAEVRGLGKDYGRVRAVHDVNLTLTAGSITGLVGPNGAGKSTTIGVLVGLVRPTRGTATVDGHDVGRERTAMLASVGYLPSVFVGRAALGAGRYLADLARYRGMSDLATIDHLAGRLGLDLDRRIGDMSHGTRQKVGVVQSLMHSPGVLLLDEPTTGLDPLVQDELWRLVDERREAGASVLLSSHVMSEVQEAADHVVVMAHGRVVLDESMDELARRRTSRVQMRLALPPPVPVLTGIPGVRHATVDGHRVTVDVAGSTTELFRFLATYGIESVSCHDDDLASMFAELCAAAPDRAATS